jgi:hypothetical protein
MECNKLQAHSIAPSSNADMPNFCPCWHLHKGLSALALDQPIPKQGHFAGPMF